MAAQPSPQRDKPSALSGGADAWDSGPAGVVLSDDYFGVVSGSTTTLAPTTGGIDVTGYAPGIVRRLAPGTGDVNVTGYAPALVTVTRLSPATGQIDITGYVPTVDYPREEEPAAGGNSAWYRPLRIDDVLPPLERERVLRPASAAVVVLRGYAPTLRRSVRIADDVEFDIPDEVLAMALELLEELETA